MTQQGTKYEKCKKRGSHDFMVVDNTDGLTEARVTLVCKDCGATAEMIGDVRTDDGRYIEYDLGDEYA